MSDLLIKERRVEKRDGREVGGRGYERNGLVRICFLGMGVVD